MGQREKSLSGAHALRVASRAVLRFARAFSRCRMEASMPIAKKASNLGFTRRQIKVGAGIVRAQRRDGRTVAIAMIAIADWRPPSLPQRRRERPSEGTDRPRATGPPRKRCCRHVVGPALTGSGVGLPIMAARKRHPWPEWLGQAARRPSAAKFTPACVATGKRFYRMAAGRAKIAVRASEWEVV